MQIRRGAIMGGTGQPRALGVEGAGGRLRRHALLAAALLSLGAAAPAAADPFGALKSMIPSLPGARPKTDPAAQAGPAPAGAPAPMGMREATAVAPLHGLGTDAVAVVETASPGAPVQSMDYVFAKQTINLGPSGKLTMSYLTGCRTEAIQGGVVTVALTGSKVAGGKLTEKTTPGCRAATPKILASASEAGATVNRVTPFSGVNWSERALRSSQPVFKWDKAVAVDSLRVKDMDAAGEPVLWQAAIAKDWIAYPPTAAKLSPGMPYKAEALAGDKVVAAALFSIDPALDVADSLASRVVPLSAP
ncbi:MAG TPA: hypothetical protein VNW53_04095 [Phenylobacterium sp.]|jgi:hypothetical protein|uniref:hypothetical protein n=1 Tax=Phenylobacterium sp. TaxID=1871053 RepID=UPI002C4A6044|nr:hypothetical protein [Phenylobacterium sp.]HXA38157.1 hypothetical protein [Phenylobacterium sp.]